MKKRTLLLAVLAFALVLSSGIGSAIAYFTSYATARGGYVIQGGRTEIEENWQHGQKIVRIRNVARTANDNGKYPVFVRARAFADSSLSISFSSDPEGAWKQDGDYWYYQSAIAAGDISGALNIAVAAKKTEDFKVGDTADVIVVYESVPAMFLADDSPDLKTAWATGEITTLSSVNP